MPPYERVAAGVDVAVVADEHDETEGHEHDAGDEEEVGVGVGVAGEPCPLDPRRLPQHVLGDAGDDVEVEPPQAHGDGQTAQQCGGVAPPQVGAGRRGPDGDDRLADGDDDDEAEAFGEVRRAVQTPAR